MRVAHVGESCCLLTATYSLIAVRHYSCCMTNLIPERRVNKNGIMTTKWVSPPSEPVAARGNIPAPMASPRSSKIYSPRHEMEIEVAYSEVGALFAKSLLKHSHRLEDLDPQVLQAVELMVQGAMSKGLSFQADKAVSTALNTCGLGDYTALNNLAVFGGSVMHPDSENYDVQALVAGLAPRFGVGDFLLDNTEGEREEALVLVTAAARIREPFVKIHDNQYSDNRTISVASSELTDFILSRPDDVERIARAVNERGTDDVDVIREVLGHGQQSLRDGVL